MWRIETSGLEKLRRLRDRLYTGTRMTADEMRDWAHRIDLLVTNSEQLGTVEDEPKEEL